MSVCECGCGEETSRADRDYPQYGVRMGEFWRFVAGHHNRVKPVLRYRKVGRRHAHRLRAEGALGKPLPKGAEVHHANETKHEDSPLVICQNRAYHRLLHARTRIVKAGGNPNSDKICSRCKRLRRRSKFYITRANYDGLFDMCKSCTRVKNHQRRSVVTCR
jgi:hypothetical protein